MSREIRAVLAVAPPDLPDVALARLPAGTETDPFWRLAAAFLVGYPPATARAYLSDLHAWARWCDRQGVHPLAARRHDVDAWVAHLTHSPQPVTGRFAAPATVVRRLSCLSGFYDYGLRELLEYSPVANVRRPRVGEDSPTIGLDAAELDRLSSPPSTIRRGPLPWSRCWSITGCGSPKLSAARSPRSRTSAVTAFCGSSARVVARQPNHWSWSCCARCSTTSASGAAVRYSSTATGAGGCRTARAMR